jgi:hypothetical protein
MLFCLGDGKYESKGEGYQKNNRIFNKEVSPEQFDKARNSRPTFNLPIATWIKKEDMTDKEKEEVSGWSEMGGYLKVLSYEDAWKEGWKTASQDFKDWVKNLSGFDSDLFEKITGIRYESEIKEMTVAEIAKE